MLGLDPTKGREQAGMPPALIISVDLFNDSAAELVVAVPITSKAKGIPLHVEIEPPEGGLTLKSYVKCEDVRSISTSRLVRRMGSVSAVTITSVEDKLRILLGL